MSCWLPFLYVLATVIFTWPLCLHLGTQVIGPFHGDNLEYVWKIWWVKHAWFDLHVSPEIVPTINWPAGYFLAYGELVLRLEVSVLQQAVADIDFRRNDPIRLPIQNQLRRHGASDDAQVQIEWGEDLRVLGFDV